MSKFQSREQFGRLIGETHRLWRLRMDERLRRLGLSQARWLTLRALRRAGDGIAQTELAARIGIEAPTLVHILDGLARSGYVSRRVSATDRRVRTVHLTARARRKLERIEQVADQLRMEAMRTVDAATMAAAVAALEQLRVQLTQLAPPAAARPVARRRRPARRQAPAG